MNLRKGMGIQIKKPSAFIGYEKEAANVPTGRPDLTVGDTLYSFALGDGEGNKYTKKKFHIIGETADLYICEHRGKYANYKECFRKADYRLALGLVKAN